MMRQSRQAGNVRSGWRGLLAQERCEGRQADTGAGFAEELAARHAGDVLLVQIVHEPVSRYSRVSVSSRLRIAKQTADSAAWSKASSISSRGDAPTLNVAMAAFGWTL